MVPWSTLGLTPADAIDQWNRRFTYAIPENSSGSSTPQICNIALGGGLAKLTGLVPYDNGAAGTTSAAFVLVSHGANGRGGFMQNGTTLGGQLAVPSGATEAYNCPRDVTVTGASCPSTDTGGQYAVGPAEPQSFGTNTWYDDSVYASNGQQFSCLCTEPSVSTAWNVTNGQVTLMASTSAQPSCTTQLATNIGGAENSWSGVTRSSGCNASSTTSTFASTTYLVSAGQTCTVSGTLTASSVDAIAAANPLNSGWQTTDQPPVFAQTFSIKPKSSQDTASGAATNMPAATQLNIPGTGTISSYSNSSTTTASPTVNGTTIAYDDGTYTLTFVASGPLCYDSATGAIGITHSNTCQGLIAGDTLTVSATIDGSGGSAPSFARFAALFYVYDAGTVTVTENSPTCPGGDTCTPSTPAFNFSATASGGLVVPWQSFDAYNGTTYLASETYTSLKISVVTGATAQVGLSQIILSP